ncbi:hypothetical protein [Burkholderia glumae]|uniref:hypothetical protein n=1 Tax=Burkholderia glumae TaxID=337 RepID=UPI000F5E2689|nr:hypothetical protein [Burkholderia glumae]
MNGNNGNFQWSGCTFDNALEDLFYQLGSVNSLFDNCIFEAVNAGKHGVVFDGSFNNVMVDCSFTSPAGPAAACVNEVNGSSGNKVISGTIDHVENWTNLFNLTGAGSFAKGFQQYGNFDSVYNLAGTAKTPQAQGTTVYYGANGGGNPLVNEAWIAPLTGVLLFATIYTDVPPASGQTFTFTLLKNGNPIASGVIQNGAFGTTITLSPQNPISAGDQLAIESVFSANSGSATPRYALTFIG